MTIGQMLSWRCVRHLSDSTIYTVWCLQVQQGELVLGRAGRPILGAITLARYAGDYPPRSHLAPWTMLRFGSSLTSTAIHLPSWRRPWYPLGALSLYAIREHETVGYREEQKTCN